MKLRKFFFWPHHLSRAHERTQPHLWPIRYLNTQDETNDTNALPSLIKYDQGKHNNDVSTLWIDTVWIQQFHGPGWFDPNEHQWKFDNECGNVVPSYAIFHKNFRTRQFVVGLLQNASLLQDETCSLRHHLTKQGRLATITVRSPKSENSDDQYVILHSQTMWNLSEESCRSITLKIFQCGFSIVYSENLLYTGEVIFVDHWKSYLRRDVTLLQWQCRHPFPWNHPFRLPERHSRGTLRDME
jgi:hypothetical protein